MGNKKVSYPLIGVIIAIIGIITPIVWDQLRGKSGLSITLINETTLVNYDHNINDLEILYKGSKIKNLLQGVFVIKNNGNRPIEKNDIVQPITINIDKGNIIDVTINNMSPKNLTVTNTVSNPVSISFDLLNPGDLFYLTVLIDADELSYYATCRIKNIKEITSLKSIKKAKDIQLTWVFYVVMASSFLMFYVTISLIKDSVKRKKILSELKNKDFVLNNINTIESLHIYTSKITFLSGTQKKELKGFVTEITKSSEIEKLPVYISVLISIVQQDSSIGGALISFVIFCLGFYYWFGILLKIWF